MRTSRKAKDAAAEKQSYVCDTLTGHAKADQPPLPGSRSVMLLGKAGEGAESYVMTVSASPDSSSCGTWPNA
jgi:hypothetical protein